ncbi:kinase-like domain-containing protein [Rhizophagus clarus]|uniref:Kinase-like domain-containing protein n=1 Tax=Rhizophagus clarus TaxID=94130 RepID=A0A8H3MEU3_9GLOM|nr:kinase-like domain-containing protein [Rhizophagus clarus]
MNDNLDEFLNEWKYHESCLDSSEIINLYGFTKDPDTLKYMVIMDYANKGSLRRNLTKIIKSNWKQRLYMLYKIISGLNEIHSQNLIHCDIHSGNILCHNNKNDNEKEDNNEEEEYDDDNEKENNEEKEENNNEEKEDEEEEYNYEYDDDEEEINYEKEENDKIYISDLGLLYYTSRSHDFTSDDLNESLRSKYMGQVDDMESLVVIF